MNSIAILAFISTGFSALLALAVFVRGRRSAANWFFLAGMLCLGAESLFKGVGALSADPVVMLHRLDWALIAKSFLPGIWLAFSLTYSRGNYREFLIRWRFVLAAAFLLPIVLAAGFQEDLFRTIKVIEPDQQLWLAFGVAGKVMNVLFLVSVVLILTNLEKTFRTAVGTMRWRIKFVVLGLCTIFGAKIYTSSQALLYSGVSISLSEVDSGALLVGCILIAVSYARAGLGEIDVYPSQSFLYSSITVLLSGIYLLIVGVLARIVAFVGGDTMFPVKSFFVLVSIVGLTMLLLSDRIRQRTKRFISRHFARPLYDYRKVWNLFTEKTANASDQTSLCATTAKLVSDTFNVLSVNVWIINEKEDHLALAASTALQSDVETEQSKAISEITPFSAALRDKPSPFDLERANESWAIRLREFNPRTFPHKGGDRICVPIVAGEQAVGAIILADRVSGIPFSLEELDLLRCIGSHVAAEPARASSFRRS